MSERQNQTEVDGEFGVDHLAVLESLIVKKDSVQNRAIRVCAYELKKSRDDIECLRSAVEALIGAFCPGDDWIGVDVRDQADAAILGIPK